MRPARRIADWCRRRPPVAAITERPSADVDVSALVRFIEELAYISHPSVVELGTRRQPGQERNRHEVWVPHAAQYAGVDYQRGEDVDIIADIHELSKHLPPESIDAVIACSTFEHIKYPWIAALEIAKILKIGGFAFIHTHQTFALHAHPHDYWRFSIEGLQTLFPPELGFEILSCHYQYPCRIVSPDDPMQALNPSYLNVCLLAKKIGPAPDTFRADLTRGSHSPS
jgi:SAM-dependent methyltransferase